MIPNTLDFFLQFLIGLAQKKTHYSVLTYNTDFKWKFVNGTVNKFDEISAYKNIMK